MLQTHVNNDIYNKYCLIHNTLDSILALQKHLGAESNILMCFSIGKPKTINFPFVPNGKLMGFRFPMFKQIRVIDSLLIHVILYSS